jgi:hypothetical protein
MPWRCVTFSEKLDFRSEDLLAANAFSNWRTTTYRLSATARSIYSQLPSYLKAVSSIRNPRTRHALVTGTHISLIPPALLQEQVAFYCGGGNRSIPLSASYTVKNFYFSAASFPCTLQQAVLCHSIGFSVAWGRVQFGENFCNRWTHLTLDPTDSLCVRHILEVPGSISGRHIGCPKYDLPWLSLAPANLWIVL